MADVAPAARATPMTDGYRPPLSVADELLQPDGSLRPVWAPLMEYLESHSPEALNALFARGDQYLHDTGVYFRQHAPTGSTERDWPLSHVPVLIGQSEWDAMIAGVVQRAELLEKVMADLYGPASLVSEGFLPAELITQNPEWLRPMVGIQPRGGNFLHFLAFELGRSPDGSWFVLGDRTQAPSGAGFALENRMATSRVFNDFYPKSNVQRLAGFFRVFRDALTGLSETGKAGIGILTPGQHTDTYYEHAYIARYLGLSLLESGDLKADGAQIKLRTIHGDAPLSVLWRRLDSRFADPLELDEDSALGTPGMVAAMRAGALTMVNSLGSGVLETRALMAFLPRIAEHLLNEPLAMPNIATWWCGQQKERDFVHDNADRMMIGPAQSTLLPFGADSALVLGGKFRDDTTLPLAQWLEQEGRGLVGQEAVSLSTTPAMINGQLVPRPMVLRVFAARTPLGWTVMPGGYARIGRTEDPTALAMQEGGSVADVWIVQDTPAVPVTLSDQTTGRFERQMPGTLPSRAADNLYWLGRYVERAEAGVRLTRAYQARLEAYGVDTLPLVEAIAGHMTGWGLEPSEPMPQGLLDLLDRARQSASAVRDRFSVDGWNSLNDLSKTAKDFVPKLQEGDDAARAMGVMLRKLGGFSGLVHENMFRFDGWRFLTMGRAIERADQMISLLIAFADLDSPLGGFDVAVELGDSVMTHRMRYAMETNRNTVIDLLALDIDNPRSLLFQARLLQTEEARLERRGQGDALPETARLILQLVTDLSVAQPDMLTAEKLADLRVQLGAFSNALAARYMG